MNTCTVDLTALGCSSTTIGDLTNEMADYINDGRALMDDAICKIALDCASAVNEGYTGGNCGAGAAPPAGTASLTGGSGEPTTADTPTTNTGGISTRSSSGDPQNVESATDDAVAPSEEGALSGAVVIDSEGEETTEPSMEEAVDDLLEALDKHADTLSNPDATEEARKVAEDALLDALSGGYEPDVRLQVAASLTRQIDVAYFGLLEKQVVAIRDEARELKDEALVKSAEQLLETIRGAIKVSEN